VRRQLPIALYGTLRRGEANHRRLQLATRLRFVQPCKIAGRLVDLGPYPGLASGWGIVVAELFAPPPPAVLATIDAFEGFDAARPEESLFVRKRATLITPRVEAWVYFYNGRDPGEEILSGDWRRRVRPMWGRQSPVL